MQRIDIKKRENAKTRLEDSGCYFSSMYGEPYMWEMLDKPSAYVFTPEEVDAIKQATLEVHKIALAVAEYAATNEEAMDILAIPEHYRDLVAQSWLQSDETLYQRMDLCMGQDGNYKVFEYNGDTPTGVVEMNCYMNWWQDAMEQEIIPEGVGHFNDFRYHLTERLSKLGLEEGAFHLAAARGLIEEENTVKFIQQCAHDIGIPTHFLYLDEIGVDAKHNLADDDSYIINNLFKLFPWEDISDGSFADDVRLNKTCRMFEPAWKMTWSNKAFLVLAWKLFPNHPNLVPAYFAEDKRVADLDKVIFKPQWGREGQNMTIVENGRVTESFGGDYADDRMIVQEYVPMPEFDGHFPILGSWLVNDQAAGVLIREDSSRITANMSTCVPHFIL